MKQATVWSGVVEGLEVLAVDAARHLAVRETDTGSILGTTTAQDILGDIRCRLEVARVQASAVVSGGATRDAALLRHLLTGVLISIVHLGGAEFYTRARSGAYFDALLIGEPR